VTSTRGPHADVFAAESDLWECTGACDVLLLRNQLQATGKLDVIGGTAFLSRIVASVPSAGNAVHYAKIVRERALERAVLAASMEHERLTLANGNGTATAAFNRLAEARHALEQLHEPEPWPPLIALGDLDKPSFPVDALPPAYRDWSRAVAENLQVPLDVPAMLCLRGHRGRERPEVRGGDPPRLAPAPEPLHDHRAPARCPQVGGLLSRHLDLLRARGGAARARERRTDYATSPTTRWRRRPST